jgi:uncharacterized protein YutE (UPF0331/DUF86 family)
LYQARFGSIKSIARCEASIDIANHIIKNSQLGVPQSARDSVHLLAQNQYIKKRTAETLKKMLGLVILQFMITKP